MGLWSEATYSLLQMTLTVILDIMSANDFFQAPINTANFKRTYKKYATNRYGLIPPENISPFILSLNAVGLDFRMLKTLPTHHIQRMFEVMDVNCDGSLDLDELLSSFEILFGNFVPSYLFETIGLSVENELASYFRCAMNFVGLLTFVTLAFNSFAVSSGTADLAMQNLLAVVGVVILQAGNFSVGLNVEQSIKERLQEILGDGIHKRLRRMEATPQPTTPSLPSETAKPLRLRYEFLRSLLC
ncbi:MAG: uncharacterized protein KVP18_004016 [Porospora cf. gigantea A]|uniref:uncharacterized protein n=1 Tax=Porospora cf. gigantea A TaxID=2853593 RepID=UPI00355A04CD|nr:MAG: hypothetical protein KVP18_004016 [Porospora cf. gigantea A]